MVVTSIQSPPPGGSAAIEPPGVCDSYMLGQEPLCILAPGAPGAPAEPVAPLAGAFGVAGAVVDGVVVVVDVVDAALAIAAPPPIRAPVARSPTRADLSCRIL
jgi:hypothetical protein